MKVLLNFHIAIILLTCIMLTACDGGEPPVKYQVLYRFTGPNDGPDGANPRAGLVQATDGNFYGTTFLGGGDSGIVFKLTLKDWHQYYLVVLVDHPH